MLAFSCVVYAASHLACGAAFSFGGENAQRIVLVSAAPKVTRCRRPHHMRCSLRDALTCLLFAAAAAVSRISLHLLHAALLTRHAIRARLSTLATGSTGATL